MARPSRLSHWKYGIATAVTCAVDGISVAGAVTSMVGPMPVQRHHGLDQVPGAVQLVAPRQVGIPRLTAHLDPGVQVAVRALRLRQQRGDPGSERGKPEVLAGTVLAGAVLALAVVGQFPADRLQGLVDVGVHEHLAAVTSPVRLDGQTQVAEVARVLELAQGQREARRQIPLLPVVQQPGGQASMDERAVGRGGSGGSGGGAGGSIVHVRGSRLGRWMDSSRNRRLEAGPRGVNRAESTGLRSTT
jgi:hypothetical protein